MYNDINDMLIPAVVKVQSEKEHHFRIILEPLERGFGDTLALL